MRLRAAGHRDPGVVGMGVDTKLEEPPETGSVFWRYIETIMNRRIKS